MPTTTSFAAIVSRLSTGFWLLFFVTLPLAKGLNSVAEVALLLLGFARTDFREFRARLWQYRHITAITLVFFALLLGMLYTQNIGQGFRILRHQQRFLVVPLAFLLHAPWVRQHTQLLLRTFLAGVALACAATVVLYWLPEQTTRGIVKALPLLVPYPENKYRTAFGLYSPFIDRIQFSSLIGLSILTAIYLLKKPKPLLVYLLLPLLLYTMMVLGGRGGQVALLAALLVPVAAWLYRLALPRLSPPVPRPLVGLLMGVAALAMVAGLAYGAYKSNPALQSRVDQGLWEIQTFRNGQYKPEEFKHYTSVRRWVSWYNMWRIIREQPLLGTGTGDFSAALTHAYETDPWDLIENIHSQYLFFWAAIGLWGLLVFLGIMAYWAFRMWHQPEVRIFALSVLLFYIVNMIPDSVLYMQVDQMAFTAFLSLIGLMRVPMSELVND